MSLTHKAKKAPRIKKPKVLLKEDTDLAKLPRYQGTVVPSAVNIRPKSKALVAARLPEGMLEQTTDLDHMDTRFRNLPLPFYWDETYAEHGSMPTELYAEWVYTMERLMVRGMTIQEIRDYSKIPLDYLRPIAQAVRKTWKMTASPDQRDTLRGELMAEAKDLGHDLRRRLMEIEVDENPAGAASLAKAIVSTQARRAALIGADAPKQADQPQISLTVATQVNPMQYVKEKMGIDLDTVDIKALAQEATRHITTIKYQERDGEEEDD